MYPWREMYSTSTYSSAILFKKRYLSVCNHEDKEKNNQAGTVGGSCWKFQVVRILGGKTRRFREFFSLLFLSAGSASLDPANPGTSPSQIWRACTSVWQKQEAWGNRQMEEILTGEAGSRYKDLQHRGVWISPDSEVGTSKRTFNDKKKCCSPRHKILELDYVFWVWQDLESMAIHSARTRDKLILP